MPKPSHPDHTLRTAIAVSLVTLAAGFAGAWFYLQHKTSMDAEVRFMTLPSVAISRDGHSMAATVAIRTSGSDSGWASGQKRALEEVVKQALMQADPVRSRGPAGLPALQEQIREHSNRVLGTDKVQEALITDFLVSEGG